MSRLLDDLRRVNRVTAPWCLDQRKEREWARHIDQLHAILSDRSLPVILADNVAQFYYEASGQEYWDLSKHFPNIAPPFGMFWVEHKFPKVIHSDECGDTDVSTMAPKGRIGWLVIAAKREDVVGTNIPPDTHWVITADSFTDYGIRRDEIQGSPGSVCLAIDKEGRLIDRPHMISFAADRWQEQMRQHIGWLYPILLTICFMHCRNVKLVDNVVPPKLAKSYRAKHDGLTPTNYKTLIIEPLKEILRSEGRSHEKGIQHAMHICRGHFKDYREGKGLFGKYHMLVWHDSVVRGTKGAKAPAREIEVKV